MGRASTTGEFVSKAKKIHGELYSYENSQYKNNHTKVIINCKNHGDFLQRPQDHLRGKGCLQCSLDRIRLSQDDFIQKARAIHGDRYNYSETMYRGHSYRIKIICLKHGAFYQLAGGHLVGHGCRNCTQNIMTTSEFLGKSKEIHGDIYIYDKTKYMGTDKKINITCRVHGDFKQFPSAHLSGLGCRKCGHNYNYRRYTLEDFILKAKATHGNKYDYSKVDYVHSHEKVEIICPEHGSFFQKPSSHIYGDRCSMCRSSKGEEKIRTFLQSHNIKFKEQKTFPDCKFVKKLKFDFYIYNNGNPYLIEYQGQQHFKPITFGNISIEKATEVFQDSLVRDQIKREWSKSKGITLLEIPFTEFENIEEILSDYFKGDIL
jgi:hypothetical protein